MSILVTGGAGYIGSHTVLELLKKGYEVVALDNLENGHRESVGKDAKFVIGDLREIHEIEEAFEGNNIEAVIHFAAYSLVGESVTEPFKYFENNFLSTLNLLKTMKKYNVKNIVFSSTAAVYGEPKNIPILETDETEPKNPYGESKLSVEKMLKWADNAYGIKHSILRYFNVAGADESGKIGEAHNPETHVIPNIINAALDGNKAFKIFGDDYDTEDGTCVRDYIHVTDLSRAHILALENMKKTNESNIFNLGNGKGFSVKEIVDAVKKTTGIDFKVELAERRPGDPAVLIASSEKIMKTLGWKPEFDSLEQIIQSAFKWHKYKNGRKD